MSPHLCCTICSTELVTAVITSSSSATSAMAVPYSEAEASKFYRDYYTSVQKGGGLPVFAGRAVMGGDGLGSALAGLARAVLPALKQGAVNLGKRALTAGANVARDVIGGANAGDSLKKRFADTGTDILGDVAGALAPDVLKKQRKSDVYRQKPSKRRKVTSAKKRSSAKSRRVGAMRAGHRIVL